MADDGDEDEEGFGPADPHELDVEKCVEEEFKEHYFIDRKDDEEAYCRPCFKIKECLFPDKCSDNAWQRAQVRSWYSKQSCLNYLKRHLKTSGLHNLSEEGAQQAIVDNFDNIKWGEWEDTWDEREKYRISIENFEAKKNKESKKGKGKKGRGRKRGWDESNWAGSSSSWGKDDAWEEGYGEAWEEGYDDAVGDLAASDGAVDAQAAVEAHVAARVDDAKDAMRTAMNETMPGYINQAVKEALQATLPARFGGPPPANAGFGGPRPANAGFGSAAGSAGPARTVVDFGAIGQADADLGDSYGCLADTRDVEIPDVDILGGPIVRFVAPPPPGTVAVRNQAVEEVTIPTSQIRTLKDTMRRAESACGGAIVQMVRACKLLRAEQATVCAAKEVLEGICPN